MEESVCSVHRGETQVLSCQPWQEASDFFIRGFAVSWPPHINHTSYFKDLLSSKYGSEPWLLAAHWLHNASRLLILAHDAPSDFLGTLPFDRLSLHRPTRHYFKKKSAHDSRWGSDIALTFLYKNELVAFSCTISSQFMNLATCKIIKRLSIKIWCAWTWYFLFAFLSGPQCTALLRMLHIHFLATLLLPSTTFMLPATFVHKPLVHGRQQ